MVTGKLRHSVVIQQLTSGSSATGSRGQSLRTWADKETVQASIEPLNGREATIAKAVIATATHKVKMYYTAYAVVKSRVKFGSRYLNVESVLNEDERNKHLTLLCTEEIT